MIGESILSNNLNNILLEIGKVYGMFEIISYSHYYNKHHYVKCKCDCGVICVVRIDVVRRDKKYGCGVHKNNITPINLLERGNQKALSWRRSIFEKYSYTCCVCNDNSGGNLNAHHLFPFAKYPKLRNNINNGVCMCHSCHIDFHKRFGMSCKAKDFFEYYEMKNNRKFGY